MEDGRKFIGHKVGETELHFKEVPQSSFFKLEIFHTANLYFNTDFH